MLVVAVAALAAGAFLFRSKSTGPRARPPASSPTAAPPAAIPPAPAGPTATTSARDGSTAELLAALREKLATSVGDALQALSGIAKTNPALAIDLAQELGRTDEERAEWVKNLTQQWCDQDVQAAWKWLGALSQHRMEQLAGGELTSVVLGAMARQDPDAVISNLDGLLRHGNLSESVSTPVAVHVGLAALVDAGKIDLAQQVVDAWARDPQKLKLEAAAYETVAMARAQSAPTETAEWLLSLPGGDERNNAIATFSAVWADHDPRGALQWAEALPDSDGRQAAIRRTVADNIEKYPNEVSAWLGDYLARAPASPATDALVATVISNSPEIRAAPQTALQWLKLISDPAQHDAVEERIAIRWAVQDRTAAEAYVWKSPTIPAERKGALVQEIRTVQEVAE